MKSLLALFFVSLLTLASHAQSQEWGQVYFDNRVLLPLMIQTPDRLVRNGWGEPFVGTNFIAELFYGTNLNTFIRLSNAPPARFPPEGTPYPGPGTWSGGMRTLVGVPPGTLTYMFVRLWDNDAGDTYEEALRNNGPYRLTSSLFTYVPPPPGSSLESHYMSNFAGFTGDCGRPIPLTPQILVQPTNQTVNAGDTVVISVVSTNFCDHQWQFNGSNINALPGSRFLVLTNVQPSQAGDYRVIINPRYALGTVTSQVARLTVRLPSQLALARYDNGAFAFHVLEDTGRDVVIETAPNLNPATPWTPVFTNMAPFWFTNSTPADRQRFYRTVIR